MIVPFPVRIYRKDKIESIHYCIYSLWQNSEEKESRGNTNFKCFTRSLIKPIQAKITQNILGKDLREEFLAITCSSHQANKIHLEIISAMARFFHIDESDLLCGTKSHSRGELDSSFHHNCSGKHIAMLAASKKMNWPLGNYIDRKHPLQILVKNELERLLEKSIPIDSIYEDGCKVPTFYMSIKDMGKIFFNLVCDESYQEILSTMIAFPEIISGAGRIDTELMKNNPGRVVSKGGAEGLIWIANLSQRASMVLKVIDGSYRAKEAAAFSFSISTS
jgi:L-asparaginase